MEYLMTFFAIVLAGAFGSFLNVVVWRLPLGMSLIHPGSHCPKCGHVIRSRDNIPLFGWLLLHGKCRDCHEPIHIRYPLVETVCMVLGGLLGYLFFVVGWPGSGNCSLYWDGLSQARLLLHDAPLLAPDPVSLLPTATVPVITWFAVFYTFLAFGLIEYDSKRIPRLVELLALVLLAVVFVLPWFLDSSPNASSLGDGIWSRSITGLKEGLVCGMLTLPLAALPWLRSPRPVVPFLQWWPDWLLLSLLVGSCFSGFNMPNAMENTGACVPFFILILTTLFLNIAWVVTGKMITFLLLFVLAVTMFLLTACG